MHEPLRPPRRSALPAERRPPPADHGQLLGLDTVLRPTRWALAGSGGTPGDAALCDGQRTLRQVAETAGLEPRPAVEVLSVLYARGLVAECGETAIPPLLFSDHLRCLGLHLRRDLLARRPGLETDFAAGAYSRRLAVGYLVEIGHVIGGAASHIGAALARAPDPETRALLSAYLEDEHWHGAWMDRGLEAAGLDAAVRARALPLPATQAILDSWIRAAHTDLLLYAGLISLTESGPEEAAPVEDLFLRTVAQGVLPEAAWRPCFEHAFGDSGADHLGLGRALFAAADAPSAEHRERLRRQVLLHAEGVVRMEHAILDFYGPAEGPPVHALEWRAG